MNSTISAIEQDQYGFMWLGTKNGLYRYDGYTFLPFRKRANDSTSLINNEVIDLTIDRTGRIWVATSNGLSRYDYGSDQFTSFEYKEADPHSLNGRKVNSVVEDETGQIWVGTERGLNLYREASNDFVSFTQTTANFVHGQEIKAMSLDEEGNIWLGYESQGISRFNPRIPQTIPLSQPIHERLSVSTLLFDGKKMWLGSQDHGLWSYDNTTLIWTPHPLKETKEYIKSIALDVSDHLWIVTNTGLYQMEEEETVRAIIEQTKVFPIHVAMPNSSSILSSTVYFDRDGHLWLGTAFKGVRYGHLDNKFRRLDLSYPNLKERPTALVQDRNKNIWIGYFDGSITCIRPDRIGAKLYEAGVGMGMGTVFVIFEDSQGRIWTSSYDSGLQRLADDEEQFISFNAIFDGLFPKQRIDIRSIYEDQYHNLWFALHGIGVVKYNETQRQAELFQETTTPNSTDGLSSKWVYDIDQDHWGDIWVSSMKGVSLIRSNGRILNYASLGLLSDERIADIFVDRKGRVWLASLEGLYEFKSAANEFQLHRNEHLIDDQSIQSIEQGENGLLWMSTTSGISSFDPEINEFKNYAVSSRLALEQFMPRCSYHAFDDQLYFGGTQGISTFLPEEVNQQQSEPLSIVISDFKISNETASTWQHYFPIVSNEDLLEQPIELQPNENVFSFEYTSLSYEHTPKVTYAYRLDGFDDDWNEVSDNRTATYTNLDPGHYTFRVKALNELQQMSSEELVVPVKVLPPFWQTQLAYLFYALFIGGILYFFRHIVQVRERLKSRIALEQMKVTRKEELNEMKLEFFTNVSHEFKTPLTLIIGHLERILRRSSEGAPHYVQHLEIYKHAQRLSKLINQLIDFRRSSVAELQLQFANEDIVSFIKNVAETFKAHSEEQGIQYHVRSWVLPNQVWFDPDKLEIILYNLISNAFKYTEKGGQIEVLINQEQSEVEDHLSFICIRVSDTGKGIEADQLKTIFQPFQSESKANSSGLGLAFTKKIVEMQGGTIQVESQMTQGTTILVRLPLIHEVAAGEKLPQKRTAKVIERLKYINTPHQSASATLPEKETGQLVLLVEDNMDMRSFLAEELTAHFRVITASDGQEGEQLALERIPDLIVSDVMMPHQDGFELCAVLKQHPRTNHIPIVLLTAKTAAEHRLTGWKLGADDYVDKPFNTALLVGRINNLLKTRQQLQAQYRQQLQVQATTATALKDELLETSLTLIQNNLDNTQFSVEIWSDHLGMSRSQLYRKIKALTGVTPVQLILKVRLSNAIQLLAQTTERISKIAYQVGFQDVNYFNKCFKKEYQISPTEYRKRANTETALEQTLD